MLKRHPYVHKSDGGFVLHLTLADRVFLLGFDLCIFTTTSSTFGRCTEIRPLVLLGVIFQKVFPITTISE